MKRSNMLMLLGFTLVFAANHAWGAIENPACTQTGPTTYKLNYTLTQPTHMVTIRSSTDPTGATGQVVLTTTDQSALSVTAGQPGQRMYFFLVPDQGQTREVSIRHLDLEGTPNFRDVGGYKTNDGRYVRWGLLYRSGVLTNLTPQDFNYLSQLDIHVVCDFRTAAENVDSPERWLESPSVTRVHYPIGGGSGGQGTSALTQGLLAGNPSPDQIRARMIAVYGDFAETYGPAYAQAFQQLKSDHLPLLYHCTAGKDRTGVFTALVLLALGVPESTILEDYSLTNSYLTAPPSSAAAQKTATAVSTLMRSFTPEQRQVLMAADPAYLTSTLKEIDTHYGSFDNYRKTVLGVSDEDRDALRAKLLTQP